MNIFHFRVLCWLLKGRLLPRWKDANRDPCTGREWRLSRHTRALTVLSRQAGAPAGHSAESDRAFGTSQSPCKLTLLQKLYFPYLPTKSR